MAQRNDSGAIKPRATDVNVVERGGTQTRWANTGRRVTLDILRPPPASRPPIQGLPRRGHIQGRNGAKNLT